MGSEGDLPNWNITSSALPEITQYFNDLPLILNGLESTKLKEKELREFLRSVTYILGDGVDTVRHSSWTEATGAGSPGKWRTIGLVTSEDSFDAIAARVNEQRKGGEQARAIDVPAAKVGNNTISIGSLSPRPSKARLVTIGLAMNSRNFAPLALRTMVSRCSHTSST